MKSKQKKTFISYHEAVQIINKNGLAPVYFIYGEEKYLHEDLIDRIINKAINPATKDFNLDLFYANDIEIEKVINIACSYPMMAARRIVVIKDINQFKPYELEKLAKYTNRPSKSSSLVLSMIQKRKTGKWMEKISGSSVTINCRELYDNEIPGWLKSYLSHKKIEIEIHAIHMLQTQVGNSLLNLVNELEKVLINIHPRTNITLADVQNVTCLSKKCNIYELCNAIGNKNFAKSIALVNKLLEQGENPTGMIIQLTKYFVNLLKINENVRHGRAGINELAKITGISTYFLNDTKRQANNFTNQQLRNAFNYLVEADFHLKTSYQKPKLIMELLLYQLILNRTSDKLLF